MSRVKTVLGAALAAMVLLAGCASAAQQQINQGFAAEDVQAQSDLQSAAVAAKTFYAGSQTYASFDSAAARATEPSLAWTDGGPAAKGAISIRGASAAGVVLVTRSAAGHVFCMAVLATGQSEGRQDAQTTADCSGGW